MIYCRRYAVVSALGESLRGTSFSSIAVASSSSHFFPVTIQECKKVFASYDYLVGGERLMPDCKHLLSVLVLVVLLSAVIQLADSSSALAQSSYRLKTSAIGSAGSRGTGSGRMSNGTLGQPATAGISEVAGTTLYAGFWKSGWWAIITDSDVPDAARNELFQNYPNPFNPATTIKYSMASAGSVALVVYNVTGQRIRTLVNESKPAGTYTTVWDGRNDGGRSVATGIYFYRLRAGSFSEVRKMILLR